MPPAASDATCKEKVWSGWHKYPCERRATKDGYCWQHHPDAVKAREEKSRQKTQEEWNRSPSHQLILARKCITALKAELQMAYENADFDEPLTFEEYRADLQEQAAARAKYEAGRETS